MARTFASASSQFLKHTGANGLGNTRNRTLAAWVKLNSTGVEHAILEHFWTGSVGTDNGFLIFINSSNQAKVYYIWFTTYTSVATGTVAMSGGQWYHIAGVFSEFGAGCAYTVYTNGGDAQSGSNSNTVSSISSGEMTLVGAHKNGATLCNLTIADAAMWGASLTAAEVAMLAKGYSPLSVRPQSLHNYIPLIRDNDQDIVSGLSLTPQGSPTIGTHAPVMHPATAHAIMGTASASGQPTALRDWVKHTGRPWRPQRGL